VDVSTVWLLEFYEDYGYDGYERHIHGVFNSEEAAQQVLEAMPGNKKWKKDCLSIIPYRVNEFVDR
jgi:hypothetical protein